MTYRKFLTASAGLAILANAAGTGLVFAQETNEDEIIVTATAISVNAEESVVPVTIIERDELIETFSGSLGDSLDAIPGVSTSFFGPASSRPIIRGLGNDRIRIVTNGLGTLDASAASPDHAVTSDILGVETIEILHGPSAIVFGGNAIGGVINIRDGRVPHELPEGGFDLSTYLGYTSVDQGTQAGGRAVLSGDGPFVLTIEGTRRDGNDYDIPGFSESAAQIAAEEAEHGDEDHDEDEHEEEIEGTVENSDFLSTSRSVGLSFVGDSAFLGVSWQRSENEYGLPGHAHEEEEEHEDEDHDEDHDEEEHDHEDELLPRLDMVSDRIEFLGGFEGGPGWISGVNFGLAMSDYTHTEFEDGMVGTIFNSDGYEARLKADLDIQDGLTGAVGIQALRRDFEALGDEAYITPTRTEDLGAFGALRYDAADWGVEAGLRADSRTLDNAIAGERSFDTASLSAGVFKTFMDGDVFTSVSFGLTERAPTDVELFSNGPHIATRAFEIGDATLDSEQSTSVDATLRWHNDKVELHGTLYASSFDGFIGLVPTGAEEDGLDVFAYTQLDADFMGFEAAAEVELMETEAWELDFEGTAEYVSADTSGENLPRIPPLQLSGALDWEWGDKVEVKGTYTWSAEQDEISSFELPTDSWQRVDVLATYQPFEDKDIRLILEGRNLLDEEIRYHTSFLKDDLPAPGRSFRFAIAGKF